MEYNDITQTGYNNYNDLQDLNDEYQGISNYLEDNPPKTSKRGITLKLRLQLMNRQEELRKNQNLMDYGYTPYKGGTDIGRFNPDYFNLEDQPYVTNAANTGTPFGESRYDRNALSEYEIEHIDDVRANNQSGFNKLMAGTAKAAVLAGTTFLDGTVGLVYGIGSAIANGDAGKLFDNEISNGLLDVNQFAERILPNYRSELEDSRSWYQNLGTANFWADFLKQAGFTVGAYYSGAAWTKALKAMNLVKSPIGARIAGSFMSGVNEGRIEANQIQNEHYNRETELLDIAFNKEKDDVMRRYYNGQLSDTEANAILETLYNSNDINKQKIKDNSDLVGLIDLAINVPILTLDNMLMFGKAYSRGFNNANKAVNSRRTFGQWFRDLQGRASENLGVLENEVALNVEKTAAGYGWNTITKGLAALKGMGHFLREGNEEMMQAYASELASALYQPDSPDAYYQALYDPNALDNTKSFYQSAVKGFSSSYGNLDRWQEFVMGGLTGLLGTVTFGKSLNQSPDTYVGKGKRVGVTGGLLGELAAANYYNQRGQANVDFMNDYIQSRLKDFDNKIRHFAMSDHYNSLMNGWAEESNKYEYENAKDNDDFEAFTRFNNAGRLQDFKDMIDQDFKDLSDEDLDLIAKSQDNNNQWKNPDGTYMSETPEGRAKMREKLEQNRQDLIKGLEYFEDAYESIVNATNDNLTNDQNLELAWLKWKVNKFNDRFENITSENKPFFQSFKEGLQEYVDAFDDSVDESKLSDDVKENDPTKLSDRLKYEFSKRIVNNARELIKLVDYLDNSSDALDFQRKAGVNYKTLNQIIDEDTYDLFAGYTSMTYDQYHDTIQNILDAAKLGIAANQFDERLQEYMNDPANIEKHHSKVRQKIDKAVDNVKSNRAALEFNDKDVSEVANMIEGLELMETDDGDLVNSSNVNITKNMSKEEKDQAKQKFDEASKLKKTKDMVIAEIERDQDIALQLDITPSDKQAAIQSLLMSFESGDMEVFMPDQTVELDVIMPQDGNDAQLLELLNDKRNVYINTMLGVVHKRKQDAEKREEHTPDIDTEKESKNQNSKQENTTGNDSVDKTHPVLDNKNNNTPQTEEQISTPEIDDSEINSQNESQKKSDDEQLNAPLSENQWKPGLSRYSLSRFRNSHPNINPQTPYYKLVKDNPSQYGYNEDSVEYKYIVNVGEYLDLVGAFENRYKGTLGKDGEIHFMISPTLNSKVGETIVLILDKDNNVIGNLPYLNARGNSQELNDFIYDCIVKYQTQDNGDLGDYIIIGKDSKPITSYIDLMYNGRIPIDYIKSGNLYVPQRHVINSIFGNSSDLIKFGITKESGENIPIYTKKSKYADPNVRSANRALKGQPFLLIKTASGQEVTVPIFMRRYSESTAVVNQESLIPTYFDREIRSLVGYVIENNNKKQFTTNIQQIANDAFNSLFSSQDFRIWFDPNTKTITQITIGGNNPVRVESKKRTLYDVVRDGTLTELMLISAIRNANMPINFDLNRINSVSQDDYIGGVKYNIAMALMAEVTLPIGVIHTIDDFFTFSPVVDGSAIKAPVLRFESKYESMPNIKILDDGVSKIDYVTWDYIASSDEHEIVYDVNDDINAFIDNNDKEALKRLLDRANLFVEKRLQPENGLVIIFLKFNTTQRQLLYDINKKQLIIPQEQQMQQQPQIDMSASPVFDGPSVSIELMNDNAGLQVQLNPTQLPLNPETSVKSSYNDVDMQEVETWFEDESPVGIIDYYHEVWGDLDESDKKKIYAIRNDFPDIGLILDEFNTDNHSDTLDALINGGLYRRVEETAQSEDNVRDEEMEWFKQTYPQLSSQERLRIVDGLIEISNSDNPGYAWGKFSRGIIEISNVAASGTVYHEAFHAISHTLMTNNEFNRMLNVARKLHPEMTNLDLEEFMAEDFRGYMLIGISQHKDNFIQRIFKLLKNIIKGLFNKQYLLTNAYYRISQGLYSNRSIKQTNTVRNSKTSNNTTAEMQLIKQQAIANGTFMKAPNGKPTNLTERQWLQVRTKAFKDWFGDWELAAYYNNIEKAVTNETLLSEFVKYFDSSIVNKDNEKYTQKLNHKHLSILADLIRTIDKTNETKTKVKFYDESKFRAGYGFISQENGDIYLPDRGNNGLTDEDIQTFVHEFAHHITLDSYFKSAKFRRDVASIRQTLVDSLKERGLRNRLQEYGFKNDVEFIAEAFSNSSFQQLLKDCPSKNKIKRQSLWSKFVQAIKEIVNERWGGGRNYNTLLDDIFELIENNVSNYTGNHYIANASKVVDENGEPLPVYHHTDNPNLTEFSTDFENYFSKDGGTKEAIFFDENKTGTLGRKYDIPVFLNIRELDEYNETKQQLHDRGTTYREVVNQSAEKNNKDGGVHMKDFDDNKMEHQSIWIVHNPNQIKSATDNNGEFSTEDDNIYYRKAQPSLLEFTQSTIKSIHDLINKIGPIKVGVTEVVELLTPKRKFRNPRTGNYDFFEDSRYFVNLATLFKAGYNPDSAFDTDGSENYYNRTQVINEIENRISKLGLDGLVYIGRNEYGAYELMPNEEALRSVYDSAYGYKTKEIVRVSANELFDASGLSTVSDILDKVISLDSRIGFLASELRRKINKNNNIEVRLVTPEELLPYSKDGRIPNGVFVPGPEHLRTSEILINKDTYRPDIIVLHEIVHMFAFNSRKNASKLKQLQRIYEDAILLFEDKYGKTKEDLIYNGVEVTRNDGTKHTIKPFYGLTNIDEFLSEAFANPLFMNELATLEFGSDKKKSISLFDRFTNWVLGILGIDRTSDVFDRTVKFLNEMFTDLLDVLEENVYQYAQNYSLYQESYFASPLYEEDLVYDKHTKFEYDNLSDDRIEYLQKSNISRWLYDRLDDDSKEMLFDCAH